jgi:hypothetical protein
MFLSPKKCRILYRFFLKHGLPFLNKRNYIFVYISIPLRVDKLYEIEGDKAAFIFLPRILYEFTTTKHNKSLLERFSWYW